MRVAPRPGSWNKPGLIGKWLGLSQPVPALPTVPEEKKVSQAQEQLWRHKVPARPRHVHKGLAVLGGGPYPRHKGHLDPVLGEASSLEEPKKSTVTSVKNQPPGKFATSLEIRGTHTEASSHGSSPNNRRMWRCWRRCEETGTCCCWELAITSLNAFAKQRGGVRVPITVKHSHPLIIPSLEIYPKTNTKSFLTKGSHCSMCCDFLKRKMTWKLSNRS